MKQGLVDLVRLIHDEFGTATHVVRNQLMSGKITVDGHLWEGDKLFIPQSFLDGKTLVVEGSERKWRVPYKSPN